MSSHQFYADLSASIFRLVVPGDNAISPSTPDNVLFDGFAPYPYHGTIIGGQVATSSFTASAVTPPSGSTGAEIYQAKISLARTFATPPSCIFMAKDPPTGAWVNGWSFNAIFFVGAPIAVANGYAMQSFAYTDTSYLYIGYYLVAFPNAGIPVAPPAEWAYRVFQI